MSVIDHDTTKPIGQPTSRLWAGKGIDFEAQFQTGVKRFNDGYRVELHRHSSTTPCGATDGCGRLTEVDGQVRLVPHSTEHDSKSG